MALPATRTAPWQHTATEQHPTTNLEIPPPKTTNNSDSWATTHHLAKTNRCKKVLTRTRSARGT